jgi:hypothetical protein
MIHIQVQPQRVPRLRLAAADAALRELAKNKKLVRRFSFASGNDHGIYMNYSYVCDFPYKLWKALLKGPLRSLHFRSASMVVCEGSNGWDNYLLLHHFDRRLKLDTLPSTNVLKAGRRRPTRVNRRRQARN